MGKYMKPQLRIRETWEMGVMDWAGEIYNQLFICYFITDKS